PRAVQSVALSKDGSLLLTMDGQYARVFDVNGAKPTVLLSQKRPVTTAALSPDAKYVVTGGKDDLAVLWSVDGKQIVTLKGHHQDVLDAEFSSDGKFVVTASADTTARVWSVPDGLETAELVGHAKRVLAACFSPKRRLVV